MDERLDEGVLPGAFSASGERSVFTGKERRLTLVGLAASRDVMLQSVSLLSVK